MRRTIVKAMTAAALVLGGLVGLAPPAQAGLEYCGDGGMCFSTTYACTPLIGSKGEVVGDSGTWWVCYFQCDAGIQTFIQATGGRVAVGTAYVQPSRIAYCGGFDCARASGILGAPACYSPSFSIGCAGGEYEVSFTCSAFGTPSAGGLGVCLFSWPVEGGWFKEGPEFQDTTCGQRAIGAEDLGGALDSLLAECVPP